METTTVNKAASISKKASERKEKTENGLTLLFGNYEFNRFGLSAMMLLIMVCAAGIAVGLGAMTSTFEIALLVFPTVITLSFIIGVAPMKLIIYGFTTSIAMSIMVSLYHVFIA